MTTAKNTLLQIVAILIFGTFSAQASAQDPEDLHPFISDDSDPGVISDGGLNANFVLVIPGRTALDRAALATLLNTTIVDWMNTFHPMDHVPQGTLVNIEVNIMVGRFTIRTIPLIFTVTHEDTWEDLLESNLADYIASLPEINTPELLGSAGGMLGDGMDVIASMMMTELLNQVDGSKVVIGGGSGNGNWCGPGTPYICVYTGAGGGL